MSRVSYGSGLMVTEVEFEKNSCISFVMKFQILTWFFFSSGSGKTHTMTGQTVSSYATVIKEVIYRQSN